MCSLGVCNFQDKFCGCQTYLEDRNNPEKCFYCNHYNAFHTGFMPPSQFSTKKLGICQKDGATCGCQAFAPSHNELKCKYCDHFTAFHKEIINGTSNLSSNVTPLPSNLTSAENDSAARQSLPSSQIQQIQHTSNSAGTSGDSRSRNQVMDNNRNRSLVVFRRRRRDQSRFQNKNLSNTVASRGRPRNVSLVLNQLLLFTQQNWENKSAPREGTVTWFEMRNKGFIAENLIFEENTPEAIDAIITRSFPTVNEHNWVLLNGATTKLKVASNQEKSIKNLRDNVSKSNKRLYIALKETIETDADDNNQSESGEYKVENT